MKSHPRITTIVEKAARTWQIVGLRPRNLCVPINRRKHGAIKSACATLLCIAACAFGFSNDARGQAGISMDDIPDVVAPQGKEFPGSVGVYAWAEGLSSSPGTVALNAKSEIVLYMGGPEAEIRKTDFVVSGTATRAGDWISSSVPVYLPVGTEQEISYHDIEISNLSKFRVHVKTPDGYTVFFYNEDLGYYQESSAFECNASTKQILFIVKLKGEAGLPAGKPLDIMPGESTLRIGLGYLPNGQSAGYLDFNPVEKFGPRNVQGSVAATGMEGLGILGAKGYRMDLPGRVSAPFYCYPTNPDVKLVLEEFTARLNYIAGQTGNHRLRQVLTPSVLVDILRQNDGTYYAVNFYPASGVTFDNVRKVYTTTAAALVTYEFASKSATGPAIWDQKTTITRTEGGLVQEASFTHECSTTGITGEESGGCEYAYVGGWTGGEEASSYEDDVSCIPWEGGSGSYEVPIPRTTTHITGFNGERSEDGAVKCSVDPLTFFKGDSYNIIRTADSARLVGKHGAMLNGRDEPIYLSTQEVAYQFASGDYDWAKVLIDLTNGNYGYRTNRRYYDIDLQASARNPGRLFWEENPDRSWSIYDYYTDSQRKGLVKRIIRPFGNTPRPAVGPEYAGLNLPQYGTMPEYGSLLEVGSLPANTQSGYCVVERDYTADWDGAVRLPLSERNFVNGALVTTSTYTYSALSGGMNNQPVWQTVATTYAASDISNKLSVKTKAYQGKDVNPIYRGLPVSVEAADGTKTCYAYERGSVDAQGNFTASGTSAFRSITVTGVASADGEMSLPDCSQKIDAIVFIDGRSTRTETVLNAWGLVAFVKSSVYSGASWALVDTEKRNYDFWGNLISTENKTGKIEYSYFDENINERSGRLQSTKDASGVTTKYSYDQFGRVTETLREAVAGVSELQTHYDYNADGRIIKKTAGPASGEQLASIRAYDFSGQLASKTEQGITTNYSYETSNGKLLSVTETRADGSTVKTIKNADGTVQSKTGSAIVPEYYEYGVENSLLAVKTSYGSQASSRWIKTYKDGLDHVVKTQQSAAGGSVATVSAYNNKGQLLSTTIGTLAPTLYTYDEMGVMTRFEQADRINSFTYGSRHDASAWSRYAGDNITWWNYAETFAFIDGDTTAGHTLTRTWTRQNNFTAVTPPAGVIGICVAETITADADGNRSVTQTFIDRDNGILATVTWSPFATQPAITYVVAGLMTRQISAASVQTDYAYDALCRPIKVIDRTSAGYGGNNLAYDPGSTRIKTITDNRGIAQHTYAYDSVGRLVTDHIHSINQATGQSSGLSASYYAYNDRGQLHRVWGDVPYPVRYEYDPATGDRIAQYTFRTGEGDASSGGDPTTFAYQPETGLLTNRTDAKGKSVSYTYTPLGQLATRAWSRDVTTTYTYNPATGQLTNVAYSDPATQPLAYAYDRLGRIKTVADATGTRTFTYRTVDQKPEYEILGALYGGTGSLPATSSRHIVNQYENSTGRFTGIKVQASNGADEYSITYAYDPVSARLASITSDAGAHTYEYLPNSNLISAVRNGNWEQARAYETNRDLLTQLGTRTTQTGDIAAFAYANDDLGRRITVDQTGEMYNPYLATGQTMRTAYTYNQRNETTGAITTVGGAVLPGRNFGYDFDPIGNRKTENIDGVAHAYTANELNQYTARATPWWLPVSGIASHGNGAQVEVNGAQLPQGNWLNNYYYKAEPKTPQDASAHQQTITITGKSSTGAAVTETRNPLARPTAETFTYDLDGNLTQDSLWDYTYDAENRLVTMTSRVANSPTPCIKFTYDYMGRRVRKNIYTDLAATALKSSTVFLYQGWTLLCEYSATPTSTSSFTLILNRRFTWGIDLSCTLGGAGDIGGLLAIEDLRPNWKGTFNPAYDGNGNLMALVEKETGNMVAAYEYDPFGNPLRTSGAYARENPIRFSGKYYDVETGLSYFGFRYYSASLGRFINRDPMEERGGWALYKPLKYRASNPFATIGITDATTWANDWEQTQARLIGNARTPNLAPEVNFKSFQSKDSPFGTPTAPTSTVTNPAPGNVDVNLYIAFGNNPINSYDALGLLTGANVRDFGVGFAIGAKNIAIGATIGSFVPYQAYQHISGAIGDMKAASKNPNGFDAGMQKIQEDRNAALLQKGTELVTTYKGAGELTAYVVAVVATKKLGSGMTASAEGAGAEVAAADGVTAARGAQVQANARQGAAFAEKVGENLSKTNTDVAPEITIKTQSGVSTRVDFASRAPDGTVELTEAKSSATAPLTTNQKAAFPEIQQTGGVVTGKGKPGFEGGTTIPPTEVDIVRPEDLRH